MLAANTIVGVHIQKLYNVVPINTNNFENIRLHCSNLEMLLNDIPNSIGIILMTKTIYLDANLFSTWRLCSRDARIRQRDWLKFAANKWEAFLLFCVLAPTNSPSGK